MRALFTGKKVESLEYTNVARAAQVKLQVRVNVSVAKPNVIRDDTTIVVRHTVMFGSPVDPFYMLVRHMTSYLVTDTADLMGVDEETVKRAVNESCVPLATDKLNESLEEICKGLGINPVQLPPAMANNSGDVTQNN